MVTWIKTENNGAIDPSTFVGQPGLITSSSLPEVQIHDGSTPGGLGLAFKSLSNVLDTDVTGKTLTNFASSPGSISPSDTILSAIDKLDGNINSIVSGVSSVNNYDNSISVSPTAGNVAVSINTSNFNNWLAEQLFSANLAIGDTNYILFNGSSDTNWRMGIGIGAFTTTIVGANTNIGIVTGTGTDGPDGFAVGQTTGQSTFEVRGYDGAAYFLGPVRMANYGAGVAVFDSSGNITSSSTAGYPGGSSSEVQYNNGGSFGGITGATTDGTTLTISDGTWNGSIVGLSYGGTDSDLSATGGTSQVLMQTSTGASITVGQLSASDLSNGVSGSGAVALVSGPALINPVVGTQAPSDNSTLAASTAWVTTAINAYISGETNKAACKYATASSLPANVYNNGSFGVGATLTATAFGALLIDGFIFRQCTPCTNFNMCTVTT